MLWNQVSYECLLGSQRISKGGNQFTGSKVKDEAKRNRDREGRQRLSEDGQQQKRQAQTLKCNNSEYVT